MYVFRFLPPCTSVTVNAFSVHCDPRNFFPDTDAFWPERWLLASKPAEPAPPSSSVDGDGTCTSRIPEGFVHNERAFIPFSHGPMNCPGKALALLELRVAVVALVHTFRARLRAGWDSGFYEREIRDFFSATRPCVPVVLEARWES